jgi:DNA-binding XRE family transcriptional regulator
MARNWKDVKRDLPALGVTEEMRASAREKVAEHQRAYLSSLRKDHGTTQTALASEMGVRQATVSEIENRELDHTEVATLRSYIEGLGGELRVTASFGKDEHLIA